MYLIRRMFSWRIANPVLSGLCRSFLWMLMGAFVLSLLLWGSSLKEQDLSMYTYIVHGIAAAFGGLTHAVAEPRAKAGIKEVLQAHFMELSFC